MFAVGQQYANADRRHQEQPGIRPGGPISSQYIEQKNDAKGYQQAGRDIQKGSPGYFLTQAEYYNEKCTSQDHEHQRQGDIVFAIREDVQRQKAQPYDNEGDTGDADRQAGFAHARVQGI